MFFQKNSILGIDITPNYVCLVELAKGKTGFSMLSHAQTTITTNAFDYQQPAVTQAISLALEQAQPKSREAVIAIDHTAVIFKSLALDAKLNEEETMVLVRKQASQYFHLQQQELMLDFTRLDSAQTPGLVDVLWVAARRRDVDPQITALKKVGLTVSQVEVNSFALQRTTSYLFSQLDAELGNSTSELVVLTHIGKESFFAGIFNRERSVFILSERSSYAPNLDQTDFICQFIQRSLQTLLSTHTSCQVAAIFLAGIGIEKLLAERVQQQCQIPTHICDPLAWFGGAHKNSSAFLLSTGLAMKRNR